MRILFITHAFPPCNVIGSLRTGKTAKYLHQLGCDVRVLTSEFCGPNDDLKMEFPRDRVIYAKTFSLSRSVSPAAGVGTHANSSFESQTMKLVRRWGRALLHFPDSEIGWFPYANSAASVLMETWRPDIILASAAPFTGLLVASHLAARYGLPWVAELRDLWVDNPYRDGLYPTWRQLLESRLERGVMRSALGFITVSQPLADVISQKYAMPVAVIPNGFDPCDFPVTSMKSQPGPVRMVLTGRIYEGLRDPSILFRAIAMMPEECGQLKISVYAPDKDLDVVKSLAQRFGVDHCVETFRVVPHAEALKRQVEADVLLLPLWNDPRDKGMLTGKLFEYLGARRPILALGPTDNAASQIIIQRNAGAVLSDPEQIVKQLREWIRQKREDYHIPGPPESALKGFTREEQTRSIYEFLEETLAKSSIGEHT